MTNEGINEEMDRQASEWMHRWTKQQTNDWTKKNKKSEGVQEIVDEWMDRG